MGRTLQYSIEKKSGGFTRANQMAMIEIAEKYNTGNYKDVWSCENYYFTPFNYYPRWDNKSTWKLIEQERAKLEKDKMQQIDICAALHKKGLIWFHNNPKNNKYESFTKVQGNEFNAFLVYQALLDLSLKIPSATIRLSDEGEFLYCDVEIKGGKAKPLISEIENDLAHYALLIATTQKRFDVDGVPNHILKDLYLVGNPYNEEKVVGWINEKLRNVAEVYNRIKKHIECDYHCISNIERQYYPPHILHRKIKASDFIDTKCEAATLLAGFNGEYYGLSDNDVEKESYEAIANIQNLLGADKDKLEVLPDIRNVEGRKE